MAKLAVMKVNANRTQASSVRPKANSVRNIAKSTHGSAAYSEFDRLVGAGVESCELAMGVELNA